MCWVRMMPSEPLDKRREPHGAVGGMCSRPTAFPWVQSRQVHKMTGRMQKRGKAPVLVHQHENTAMGRPDEPR